MRQDGLGRAFGAEVKLASFSPWTHPAGYSEVHRGVGMEHGDGRGWGEDGAEIHNY
jgi:hypothetical protein